MGIEASRKPEGWRICRYRYLARLFGKSMHQLLARTVFSSQCVGQLLSLVFLLGMGAALPSYSCAGDIPTARPASKGPSPEPTKNTFRNCWYWTQSATVLARQFEPFSKPPPVADAFHAKALRR